MSESTYRQLEPKDSARITCQATVNGPCDPSCGKPATICETCHWNTGNTGGTSFFYFCDDHDARNS